MAELQLNLLGPPQIILNGASLAKFHTAKTEALLYYLAMAGQPQPREILADLLWPEMPEAQARRNLTQSLTALRKQVGAFLVVEPQQVAFERGPAAVLDVAAFEAGAGSAEVDQLRAAAALYQGDFLEGLYVRDALPFEEWLLNQRERLRALMLQALDKIVTYYASHRPGEAEPGLTYARQLLTLDPWRETAHRQMMLLLAGSGQRSAALAQYETCRRILAEELGVEPAAETTALYEQLKATGAPPPHNLPPPPNTFLGRTAELSQIKSYLNDHACRLLTIVGPGGMGKSRLALEEARRQVQPERPLR